MNIFETHEGFSGRFDPDSTGGTLQFLLTLAGSDGFERGGELRSLCFDVLDRDGTEKGHASPSR